jgi:hypothetical protein
MQNSGAEVLRYTSLGLGSHEGCQIPEESGDEDESSLVYGWMWWNSHDRNLEKQWQALSGAQVGALFSN